jgi:putative ABC transport system permease protein
MGPFAIIALRNLLAHRTRSLILGGAIASVTAMMVLMMAVTSGIETMILKNASALSTGYVNIAGFYKVSQTSAGPLITQATKLRELATKQVPEATRIVDRVKGFGKIISETNSVMVPMWGVDVEAEKDIIGPLPLAQRREYIEEEADKPAGAATDGNMMDLAQRGRIAIFASHAKKLKVKVGDMVTLAMPTFRKTNNTMDVKVAAILKDAGMMSAWTTFAHHADMREIYDMAADTTGQVMIYLKSTKEVPAVEDRLRKAVADAGFKLMDKEANPYWMKFDRVSGESWTGQKIDITTWQDETAFVKWILDVFHALTFLLTLILMTIVVLGLMNNLWMSIRERTAEIGTMRAIGLQRRKVLVMFFLESLFLSIASVGAGVAVGALAAFALNALHLPVTSEAFTMFLMSSVFTLDVRMANLVMTFVLLTVLLVLGALYPAYQASKMKPITAINHVS